MSEVKNPLFSIILPTFNRRAMCERAIRSVLRQDDPDWELIVVDDGSSDGTRETVSSLGIPNVRYLWTENHGAANARNLGIRAATGQFICFLDSGVCQHSCPLFHAARATIGAWVWTCSFGGLSQT